MSRSLSAKLSTSGCRKQLHAGRPVVTVASAAVAEAEVLAPPTFKIRFKLKSYWVDLLTESTTEIINAVTGTGAVVSGPVPLPTRRRIYCVLRYGPL